MQSFGAIDKPSLDLPGCEGVAQLPSLDLPTVAGGGLARTSFADFVRTPQSRSGAGRSCRQPARQSGVNSTDGWRSCDTTSITLPVSDLDVVIATSHGAAISALQGLMSGRHVLQRNCVPHITCVSCPTFAAPQCNCSTASMIVHGTHTHLVIWHVKVARPSWSTRTKRPSSATSTGAVHTSPAVP